MSSSQAFGKPKLNIQEVCIRRREDAKQELLHMCVCGCNQKLVGGWNISRVKRGKWRSIWYYNVLMQQRGYERGKRIWCNDDATLVCTKKGAKTARKKVPLNVILPVKQTKNLCTFWEKDLLHFHSYVSVFVHTYAHVQSTTNS